MKKNLYNNNYINQLICKSLNFNIRVKIIKIALMLTNLPNLQFSKNTHHALNIIMCYLVHGRENARIKFFKNIYNINL